MCVLSGTYSEGSTLMIGEDFLSVQLGVGPNL